MEGGWKRSQMTETEEKPKSKEAKKDQQICIQPKLSQKTQENVIQTKVQPGMKVYAFSSAHLQSQY